MTTLAIELHDAGIRWVDESGASGPASPGYALWDGGSLVVGPAALARAREKPRFTHHRFWQDLDTEPLGKPFPRDLAAADLVHAQLSEVCKSTPSGVEQALLVVPGSFSDRQLGLILGIARASGLPVAGLVDLATAATAAATAQAGRFGRRLLHLDVHLHRVVLTELEMSDPPPHLLAGSSSGLQEASATVARRQVRIADAGGLATLHHAWARRVAELFVHTTRYDPLHSATAEQALYRRLPGWLEELRSAELIEATLGPEGQERSIELTRPDLVDAADPFYETLPELILALKRDDQVTLLLAPGLAELPGLTRRLAELRGVLPVPLSIGSAAAGALQTRDQITSAAEPGSEALPFITRLSFDAPLAAAEPTIPRRPAKPMAAPADTVAPHLPTHVLHEGLAVPISDRHFWLGRLLGGVPGLELESAGNGLAERHACLVRRGTSLEVEDHSDSGAFLNDRRVQGRVQLAAGDRLRLGTPGVEVQVIAVLDGAPSPTSREN